MKNWKYLFICSFVIMGIGLLYWPQNVDAYDANSTPNPTQQPIEEVSQTTYYCQYGHENCDETHANHYSSKHQNGSGQHHRQSRDSRHHSKHH